MDPTAVTAPLSPALATGLAILYTTALVAPFYLNPITRPSATLSRDHPRVIQARCRLVTTTCLACAPVSVLVLRYVAGLPWAEVGRLLGWIPAVKSADGDALGLRREAADWAAGSVRVLLDALRPLLLTMILFAGPLYEKAVVNAGWRRWMTGAPMRETFASSPAGWVGWRNYVVGPISEEFLYRSLLLPLYLLSSTSASPLGPILLAPLPFALAHLHHLHALRCAHPHAGWLPLVLGALLQFGYTALFGWFAAFVFVRTGTILGPILSHSFCNWMGFPQLMGWVQPDGESELEKREREARGIKPPARGPRARGEYVLWDTVVYYALLVLGLVLFRMLFWRLTDSAGGLVEEEAWGR